jgi:phosphoglycolate phosphatase
LGSIKAIVVDIDGTITDMDRRVGLEAVKAIREIPIPVILATGNVICFVRAASKLIGASDMMIGENGGVVLSGFDSIPIVLADIEECRRARDEMSGVFNLESLDESYRKSELAFRRNIDLPGVRAFVAERYPGLEVVDTGFALHLKHRAVNKGTGLDKIASIMGIGPSEFAAMGDSENDLEMFRRAGTGIAVGNALPGVKAEADYVSTAKYGDGAAEGLRWLAKRL